MLQEMKTVPGHATHEVFNQVPPLVNYNIFEQDAMLVESVRREDAAWVVDHASALGSIAGSEEAIQWSFDANTVTPVLHTFDRTGQRIDEVTFHPSWHNLMRTSINAGAHALSWREERPGRHVARAAVFYVSTQMEGGHCCPISMTHAVVSVLRGQPHLAATWEPLLTSLVYEPGLRPLQEKQGILCGMGMTEKQGGSDVRANTTQAVPYSSEGELVYLLTGHKWFCSAPMCDMFLVLAQAPAGLTCFLLPRILPDGTRNRFLIQRLKDKLGNRSNASSEVEFDQAWALRVGEEGRGVRTIIDMVNFTRLDCVIGSAAGMRQAAVAAVHHAAHRKAFGRLLIDQPLMRNVLADLTIESEAATLLAMRLARACDRADDDAHEALMRRIGTAVGKYWVAKRSPGHAAEALECLGGNGYIEESIMPRLYREAPLNSIWEGSGNVNCLDVLRAMQKEPASAQAFLAEVTRAQGMDARLDVAIGQLKRELSDFSNIEVRARRLVEQMALVLQGALLVQYGQPAVAEAFCASRLAGDWGRAFGTLPVGTDFSTIIERARVNVA
ncbi:MAG TPA: acyl-CoA dehydrogenase family protein [Ktedonobacteraceae bacterium]|nr:acyl-CoA dehydrogenase family protein [Ktedonobacteraceae bacterium]